MKRSFFGFLAAAMISLPLFGADVSGNWSLSTQFGGRQTTLALILHQNGSTLNGSLTGPRRSYAIQKGSVDDSGNVKFQLGGKGPFAGAKVTGKLDGDQLRVTIQTSRGEAEGVGTRSQQ